MSNKVKKIVLAYSGGLDTSYCAHWLSSQDNTEVHAVAVNTGGFDEQQIDEMKTKALAFGVAQFECINAEEELYNSILKYLIFGNVLRNNTYPLSVSAERVVQAIALINYANSIGAEAIAHGSKSARPLPDTSACPRHLRPLQCWFPVRASRLESQASRRTPWIVGSRCS